MTNRNVVYLIVGIVVVAAIIFFVAMRGDRAGNQPTDGTQATSSTRSDVPADTRVPEPGETDVPENVATPGTVTAAAPGVEAKIRTYEIKVEDGAFTPNTVIVRQGDTTTMRFTAVDGDYDFVQPDYSLRSPLPEGVTRIIEFAGITPGKYTFYCESCGGPQEGPVGYVVVVPRE